MASPLSPGTCDFHPRGEAAITEQSMENMEYVRKLLERKQPEFAATLELAMELLRQGATRTCEDVAQHQLC
jgi:hypothetical protein